MHINVHSHIFTLRTVLTQEAIRVISQRLEDRGFPDLIVRAFERLLEKLLDRPEVLDERELLARLLTELREVAGFDEFIEENLARLPFNVVVRGEGLESLGIDTLRTALDQLTTAMGGGEAGEEAGKSPYDIVQTVRLAMRSTITEVADEILDQIGPDDALVALMMDIRAPDEPQRDRDNFLRQVAGTREAALQRPGRVFPFFAIHPDRPDHYELMEAAIDEGAFVGVKLYPSLGYEVDGPELRRVYEFCIDRDVPVLLHCSHGGFYRDEDFIEYCDPGAWEPVLQGDLAELRVCFAHFGGWQSLGTPGGLDPTTWGGTILRLMRERPNVYTDLAYHSDQMVEEALGERYFETLTGLLEEPHVGERILFGTDSWLLRLDMTEEGFWRYYRNRMSEADFDRIATVAPRLFLGFPREPGGEMRPNLGRHLDWLRSNADAVGAEPAAWLAEMVEEDFIPAREPADWNKGAYAVRVTYLEAKRFMTSAQVRAGYRANRNTPLSELTYFRPRDPNFELLVEQLAVGFVGRARDWDGVFRESWTEDAARTRLEEVARKGTNRLVDVAGLLDSIFLFEEELV